ncbi:hypothetical protein D3C80_2136740 [compost metagenome]
MDSDDRYMLLLSGFVIGVSDDDGNDPPEVNRNMSSSTMFLVLLEHKKLSSVVSS